MKRRQQLTREAFQRAADFLTSNPLTSTPDSFQAQLAALKNAATTLATLGGQQEQLYGSRKHDTQLKVNALATLRRDQLAQLRKRARGLRKQIPAVETIFRPSTTSKSHATTLDVAHAAAANVVQYKDQFIAAGAPSDFVGQLNAAIASVDQILAQRDAARSQRVGVTEAVRTAMSAGHDTLHLLDAMVHAEKGKDATFMTAWRTARRVVREANSTPAQDQPGSGTSSTGSAGSTPSGTSRTPSTGAAAPAADESPAAPLHAAA